VEAAGEAGRMVGEENIKVAVSIENPHPEVLKLLNMIDRHEDKKDSAKAEELVNKEET